MYELIQKILNDPVLGKIVLAILLSLLIVSLSKIIQRNISKFVKDSSSNYRIRKFVNFFGFILIIITISIIYSNQLGGLTVALGVTGAGIAFALQEVIASIAGWVALVFGKFYKVGDRVLLGGIKGDVIDIGIFRTTIMECGDWIKGDLYNGRVVRIANSFVFKEPVYNYSADFPFLWDEIVLPIRYGSDIDYTSSTFLSVANRLVGEYAKNSDIAWKELVSKFMIENAKVDPTVTIEANENWINFTIRYIVDYKLRRTTKHNLYLEILKEVEQSDSKIIIAGATLEIIDGSKISVKQEV
jgi:small-conductance mechanosensitive channel